MAKRRYDSVEVDESIVPAVKNFEEKYKLTVSKKWLIEVYNRYENELNHVNAAYDVDKLEKIGKIGPIICLLLGSLGLILSFFFGGYGFFIIMIIIAAVALIVFAILHEYEEIDTFRSRSREISTLSTELLNCNIMYFSKTFCCTPEQINYELVGILNAHPELRRNWWLTKENSEVIENALDRKLRLKDNEYEKSDLYVENLRLRNESISIDNSQKRFWTCDYCGNVNRGEDMSCIKCGGLRKLQ